MAMESPSQSTMLAASTLVYNFYSSDGSENNRDASEIVRMLTEKLGHQCKSHNDAEKDKVSTL